MELEVIVVDDDPVCLWIHSRYVSKCNLCSNPLKFPGAIQALKYLESKNNNGNVTLIFLDINMPDMSGWDLIEKIVSEGFVNIFVAIVTSSVDSADLKKSATYENIIGYFEKPLSLRAVEQLKHHKIFTKLVGN